MADGLQISLPSILGVATYPPGATFGPRHLHDYEFVWVIEGDAEYRYGDQTVAAPQGSVVLCRPGWVDFFRWDTQRRTRHGFFHFSIQRISDDFPHPDQWPVVRPTTGDDVLLPLFRHVLAWNGKGSPLMRELAIKGILTAFVTGETAAGELPVDSLPDPVEAAWTHLHRRLEEDPAAEIDLRELADVACVTPEHLCRLFRKSTGRSPVRTVLLARLDRAAVLLARSNYSVEQIARICGFASQFHFSRRFREAFGQSPMQLRQAMRNGATPPTSRLLRNR